MARIDPVGDADANEEVQIIFDGATAVAGRVPNFLRTLAHSPALARWVLPLTSTAQRAGHGTVLDAHLRELAIVRTSLLNKCAYCVSHNRSLGLATGLSEEQLDALDGEGYLTSSLFDERERLVIDWAGKVTLNQARYATALYARLEEEFSAQEIVEMTMASAVFNMVNRVNESLHIDLEEQSEVDKIKNVVGLDADALHEYVAGVNALF